MHKGDVDEGKIMWVAPEFAGLDNSTAGGFIDMKPTWCRDAAADELFEEVDEAGVPEELPDIERKVPQRKKPQMSESILQVGVGPISRGCAPTGRRPSPPVATSPARPHALLPPPIRQALIEEVRSALETIRVDQPEQIEVTASLVSRYGWWSRASCRLAGSGDGVSVVPLLLTPLARTGGERGEALLLRVACRVPPKPARANIYLPCAGWPSMGRARIAWRWTS